MAGIIPGILMGLALVVVVMLEVRRNHVVTVHRREGIRKRALESHLRMHSGDF